MAPATGSRRPPDGVGPPGPPPERRRPRPRPEVPTPTPAFSPPWESVQTLRPHATRLHGRLVRHFALAGRPFLPFARPDEASEGQSVSAPCGRKVEGGPD